jgi:tetratricopeptide (TPR) repeat protein
MLLKWLDAIDAKRVGISLADEFLSRIAPELPGTSDPQVAADSLKVNKLLQSFLARVDRETGGLKLNTFRKAALANTLKWRLLESGVQRGIVDELTQAVVLRLSAKQTSSAAPDPAVPVPKKRRSSGNASTLFTEGNNYLARGAYAEAIDCYRQLLSFDPRHASACNNLGLALSKLGHYPQAEQQFRRAVGIKASLADAHFNLGTLLRWKGEIVEAEAPLRRALKLKPTHIDAQVSLGATLMALGRLGAARGLLDKALKVAPRHVDALLSLAQLAAREGRFAEAESLFRRALEVDAKAPSAWAGLAGLRKMTPADEAWLKGAQHSADSGLPPLSEASVRYAIGKYYDDIGEFARAFRAIQRANELTKRAAQPYDPAARAHFVDDLVRVYARTTVSRGAVESALPVLVVGMPRAGTTLIEQIIASHPRAHGAGELGFWAYAVRKHPHIVAAEPPGEALSRKLAEGYLRTLSANAAHASRVVDKAPFNSDYLGLIHSVLPNARVIYVRRDPIDTCLSCYFQDFPPALNFTLDLSDLKHYYREHQRLVTHWHSVLPPDRLLDVPYAGLVADQERWTRRILEFVGLEWDERCLAYHTATRPVLTTSYYQVRQRLYDTSVGRWRNYKKFIGPLLELGDSGA